MAKLVLKYYRPNHVSSRSIRYNINYQSYYLKRRFKKCAKLIKIMKVYIICMHI